MKRMLLTAAFALLFTGCFANKHLDRSLTFKGTEVTDLGPEEVPVCGYFMRLRVKDLEADAAGPQQDQQDQNADTGETIEDEGTSSIPPDQEASPDQPPSEQVPDSTQGGDSVQEPGSVEDAESASSPKIREPLVVDLKVPPPGVDMSQETWDAMDEGVRRWFWAEAVSGYLGTAQVVEGSRGRANAPSSEKISTTRRVGELLGVDDEAVWLATDTGIQTVPLSDIVTFQIHLRQPKGDDAVSLIWGTLGMLTTPSHGYFFVYTAPLWALATGGAVAARVKTEVIRLDATPENLGELYQFARFPQGIPPVLRLPGASVEPCTGPQGWSREH